ncbi:MAG: hypothetical protein ACHQQ3_13150 [Gemmatimonadales bacterium]
MNTDLLLAFGGLTFLAIIGVLYGLYDERRSKRADASKKAP